MPLTPPLTLGDIVAVRYRTGSGVEQWTGSVVEVLDRYGLVRISDGNRTHTAAVRGAAYIKVLIPASDRIHPDGIAVQHAMPLTAVPA